MKKILIIIIAWLGIVHNSKGSYLIDVFNNKSIDYQIRVNKVTASQTFAKQQIDVNCAFFVDKTNKYDATNKAILNYCTASIQDELNYLRLYKEAKRKAEMLNVIDNSYDRYSSNRISKNDIDADIEEIDCYPVCLVDNIVFLEIKYVFTLNINNGHYESDSKVNTKLYATINISTNKINIIKNDFSKVQEVAIKKIIAPYWNQYYHINKKIEQLTENKYRYRYDDRQSNLELLKNIDTLWNTNNQIDQSEKLNIQEADLVWVAWGLQIKFPQMCETSKLFNGEEFFLFIPLHDAKKIVANNPSFAVVKNKQLPATSISNYNQYNINKEINKVVYEPQACDMHFKNKNAKPPKTLWVKHYNVSNNKEELSDNVFSYDFNSRGQILRQVMQTRDSNISNVQFYDYDAKYNTTKRIKKDNYNADERTTFMIDNKNNLAQQLHIEKSGVTQTDYFYNGTKVYYQIFTGKEQSIPTIQLINNDAIDITGNTKKNAIGIISKDAQIIKDANGNIVEMHKDKDRYHYYYTFDTQNRLTKYQYFDQQQIITDVEFVYVVNEQLPSEKKTINNRNGNSNSIVEKYDWEYFD
jgi:hypothetical protein